ncbi:MAG: hypothetical protein LiPW30_440 [Parcubacteria group bacterium LiPW_30]|nr:MAG: hypothetical protein LiPW30_440 [Parcubacteria group bacterium LiPW_30]
MKERNLFLVTIIIVVGVVLLFIYKKDLIEKIQVFKKDTTVTQEPVRTDFGSNVPADFPADIPIEEGVKTEQSYSLNYVGQKQLTIVFISTKTVKENYAFYADFLAKQGWNVSNKFESPKLSSLYGTKESNDINVTISEKKLDASVKSQVSISFLKK